MSTVTNVPQLIFNKVSTEKYEELKANGELIENQFYITPDDTSDIPENVVGAENYVNAKLWKGTLEEYEALESYDDAMTYIITDDFDEGSFDAYTRAETDTLINETKELINTKQDTLISGTNVKTINGESILGEGDYIIDALPPQENNIGKFLTTDGSNAKWDDVVFTTITYWE